MDSRGLEVLRSTYRPGGYRNVRETSVQTSPTGSMRTSAAERAQPAPVTSSHFTDTSSHLINTRHSRYDDDNKPLDYRTIVKVYGNSQREADIIEMPSGVDPELTSASSGARMPGVGKDEADFRRVDGQSWDPPVVPPIYATVKQDAKGGSDGDSDSLKNSSASLDSYQTRAMNAIRALDEVVENETSDLESSSSTTAPPLPPPLPPPGETEGEGRGCCPLHIVHRAQGLFYHSDETEKTYQYTTPPRTL